jgi:hypothetical protein
MSYARISLMGHGFVTGDWSSDEGGLLMVADCRDSDMAKPETRFYGMGAIFEIRPCTKRQAEEWFLAYDDQHCEYCPTSDRLNSHEGLCDDGVNHHDLPF